MRGGDGSRGVGKGKDAFVSRGRHRYLAGMSITTTFDPSMTMRELLQHYPGAQRALFRRYHIGGCSSCGFQPDETLEGVCARNNSLPVGEVIEHILASHEADLQMQL